MIQDMINSDNVNSTESTIPNIFKEHDFIKQNKLKKDVIQYGLQKDNLLLMNWMQRLF